MLGLVLLVDPSATSVPVLLASGPGLVPVWSGLLGCWSSPGLLSKARCQVRSTWLLAPRSNFRGVLEITLCKVL